MNFRRKNIKRLEKIHNLILVRYLIVFNYWQNLEALREIDTGNKKCHIFL